MSSGSVSSRVAAPEAGGWIGVTSRHLPRRFLQLDGPILIGIALWAALAVVLQLRLAAHLGGAFTGVSSLYPPDQFQYLTWIRDSGTHGLIGDHFQLGAAARYDFLQPMFLISGLLWRLGLSLAGSYLVWAPVAVILTWWGFRALVRRHLAGGGATAALVLGLCYMSPFVAWALHAHGPNGALQAVGGELSNLAGIWGYFPRAIAVALLPLLLLGVEAILEPRRRKAGRSIWFYAGAAGAAALFAAWLHPWQGAIGLFIVVGSAVWSRPPRRRLLALGIPAIGAALPLLYYEALVHYDAHWRIGNAQSNAFSRDPLALLASFLPLVVIAAFGAKRSWARSTHRRLLLLWIAGAVLGYFATSSFPLHMFDGLALPLAILAVQGWQSPRFAALRRQLSPGGDVRVWTPVAVLTITLCTLPGLYYLARLFHFAEYNGQLGTSFTASDDRALAYLDRSRLAGGVLAPPYIAAAVPPFTGRNTWTGQSAWTPHYGDKQATDWELFHGMIPAIEARRTVEAIGARFVLVDCHTPDTLSGALGSDILGRHRFGCAAVYELRPASAVGGKVRLLAEGLAIPQQISGH